MGGVKRELPANMTPRNCTPQILKFPRPPLDPAQQKAQETRNYDSGLESNYIRLADASDAKLIELTYLMRNNKIKQFSHTPHPHLAFANVSNCSQDNSDDT